MSGWYVCPATKLGSKETLRLLTFHKAHISLSEWPLMHLEPILTVEEARLDNAWEPGSCAGEARRATVKTNCAKLDGKPT